MGIALAIIGGLALAGLAALLLLGRGDRITRGRYGRMARIGRLSARLWTSWLGAKVRRLFMSRDRARRYDEERRKRDAEAATRTMGQMKGAFMKLGQMMSFVSDAVPAEFRTAMEALQARAPAMDFALIRDVAERELGRPLERAFARFDEEPLASASIGQVHRAVLPDGAEVVVKIQYPGVAEAIAADLQNVGVLYRMAGMLYPALDPAPVVEELGSRIGEELDYEHEARSQMAFHDLYDGHPFIRVPRVYASHSRRHVLTSEYVSGRTMSQILDLDQAARDRYAEIVYRFVFGSLIRFGVFNGDPHPGNYLFTDDGRVVFLDFGCVKYFPEPMLRTWMQLLRAYFEARPDAFRDRLVDLGFFPAGASLTSEQVMGFIGNFYQPFRHDSEFTFTREYNATLIGDVLKPTGEFQGMSKKLNLPADFVFVNRIQWGVFSILSRLGATGNWHAIHREYMYGDAPRTELGAAERAYRERWAADRGLDLARPLVLRQDGARERVVAS